MAKTDELVLVGGENLQKRKASKRDWSKAKTEAFLSTLAETCNVTLAAADAGVSTSAAYRRRKLDAGFRGAWMEAIATAYQRLEMVLLERTFVGPRSWSGERMEARSGWSSIRTSSR